MSDSQTLESMLVCTKPQQDKKPRQPEEALKCPRCDSTSTKFCYYNNYSLSQPRYFCKSCRRYWTKGGTLRNVPVGGGCRKNKRSASCSSTSSSTTSKRNQDQSPLILTNNSNPHIGSLHTPFSSSYDSSSPSDLTLAFARLQNQASSTNPLGLDHHRHDLSSVFGNPSNTNTNPNTHCFGQFDGLRNGFLEAQSNLHSLYYGNNNNNSNIGGNGSMGLVDMAPPPYHEELSVKHEIGENRVLMGLPWQIGGGDGSIVDLDSGRQSWSGFIGSSNWHGLINSPLM